MSWYIWVIDQVSRQEGWILAKFFFFHVFVFASWSINSQKKKEWGQYAAILTEQAWSIKDLWYGSQGNFSCGTRRIVSTGADLGGGCRGCTPPEMKLLKFFTSPSVTSFLKPWPNGLASRHKLKTWVYLRLCLARADMHLRWLALTLVEIKFAHKSTQVEWRPLTY